MQYIAAKVIWNNNKMVKNSGQHLEQRLTVRTVGICKYLGPFLF